MKNIITIFKKEFSRVMTDKRLIFTTIFLPGLAIFLMYSLIGNALGNQATDIQQHNMTIYYENAPQEFLDMIQNDILTTDETHKANVTLTEVTDQSFADIKDMILNGKLDLYIQFPSDFTTAITQYMDENYTIPNINTYYNPSENYSNSTYGYVNNYINYYSQIILYDRFGNDIQVFTTDQNNADHMIFNEDKAQGKQFANLLPMLIVMFLFSGAMSIGPDAIAGEKERGTIATLLVTPAKRSQIAIGKVLSLSAIALLSATSSFIGILLSLPKLMQQGDATITNIYGLSDYFKIFIVLLATVLFIVALISMISAYAKTIKEAGMLILPFYFLSIIIAISSMFSGEASANTVAYVIPIFNSVNMLISILTFDVNSLHFILMIASDLLYVGIIIYVINRLFQSETVMFSK